MTDATHTHEQYATRQELAELVQIIDRRMDTFEHGLNRMTLVLGSAEVLCVVMLVLILHKVGI